MLHELFRSSILVLGFKCILWVRLDLGRYLFRLLTLSSTSTKTEKNLSIGAIPIWPFCNVVYQLWKCSRCKLICEHNNVGQVLLLSITKMCLSVFGLLQRTFFLQPLLILSTATKFRIYFPPRVIGQLASIFHRPLSPSGTWVGALQIEALVSYGSENIFRPKLFKMLISGIIYKLYL